MPNDDDPAVGVKNRYFCCLNGLKEAIHFGNSYLAGAQQKHPTGGDFSRTAIYKRYSTQQR